MPLPSQRSYRCRRDSWLGSEKPIRAPSSRATSQWLRAHFLNSAMPPTADRAIFAARTCAGLPWWAVRMAIAISSPRDPNWAPSICGRAADSSPKNPASISLSAVQPAKCSRPV